MSLTIKIRAKYMLKTYNRFFDETTSALDVGCGSGEMAKYIHINTGCKIYGTDIKNFLTWNMPFKKLNKNALPFKTNMFDIAMLNGVVHHIPFDEQIKLIKEGLRVAKMVLIYDDLPHFRNLLFCWTLNKLYGYGMPITNTYRSQKNWESLFRTNEIGFKRLKIYTPFWYPLSHLSYKLEIKQTI